jgi:hypothetical protein
VVSPIGWIDNEGKGKLLSECFLFKLRAAVAAAGEEEEPPEGER